MKLKINKMIPEKTVAVMLVWLNSRGGRTLNDLLKDNIGYYFLSANTKIHIPPKRVMIKQLGKIGKRKLGLITN